MGLNSGTRVGVYEIVAAIGAGGMGEVYRARDTKLNRDVAIKILPDAFALDADRLARFTREAQTLAALNHTNIAAIYGLETSSGIVAIVMELVEGEDLSAHIARGAIAPADALPIAMQIADALAAAHEQGIVHRDLKPANVKVRADGAVKVLDFGLAKALTQDPGPGTQDVANSPTLTARATQMGMVLGTAAYMAPEQAKGRPVDRRADLWAFGAVLYEMLTGRRAFEGGDVTEVLASVIKDTPSLDALPPGTPASIRRLLRRCLQKDPRERLADASTARLEIAEAISGGPSAVSPGAPASRGPRLSAVTAGAALLLALATGAAVWWLKPAPTPPVVRPARLTQTLPAGVTWTRAQSHVLALSPDGSRLAYIANGRLNVRALDQFEATPVNTVNDPAELFFSPDGEWVGYYSAGRLLKIAMSGGTPVPVCQTAVVFGAHWTPDDWIVFTSSTGIMRVPVSGGTPEVLVKSEKGERFGSVQMLPGGRAVLFSASIGGTNWEDAEIAVHRLDTGERSSILRGGSDARYLPNGDMVYGRGPDLMAVPFDLATLKMRGAPVPVVNEIAGAGVSLSGAYQYAVSDNGILAYIAGAAVSDLELAWIDRSGRATVIASEAGAGYPRLSPDGTRIVFSAVDAGNADIFIRERARNTRSRLTFDPARDTSPIWTYDSKRIIYGSARDGAQSLYWQAADGTGTAERLTTGTNDQYPYAVTPDDKTVIYIELDPTTSWNIYAMPLAGDRKPVPLLATPFDERRPSLSPDGKFMVYQSNESGQFQLFVRPFPNVDGGRWQVPGAGGSSPLWVSPREIYYRSGHTIQRVEVFTTPSVSFGSSSLAFQTSLTNDAGGITYAVTGDAKQALVVREATGSGGSTEYRLVFNWFEDLKARVRSGK